jgi:hypothetical protein
VRKDYIINNIYKDYIINNIYKDYIINNIYKDYILARRENMITPLRVHEALGRDPPREAQSVSEAKVGMGGEGARTQHADRPRPTLALMLRALALNGIYQGEREGSRREGGRAGGREKGYSRQNDRGGVRSAVGRDKR